MVRAQSGNEYAADLIFAGTGDHVWLALDAFQIAVAGGFMADGDNIRLQLQRLITHMLAVKGVANHCRLTAVSDSKT